MAEVTFQEDGDSLVLRWQEDGVPYTVRAGDDVELEKAFKHCVAEGLTRGFQIQGDVEREVAAVLTAGVGIGQELRVTKDAGGNLIIAYYFFDSDNDEDDAERNALAKQLSDLGSGRIPPEDIHLTILYLGDPASYNVDVVKAVTCLESTRWTDVKGTITGLGRFVGDPNGDDVIVALIDSPGLDDLRNRLRDQLYCTSAVVNWSEGPQPALYSGGHGFVPHVTLGYISPSTPWATVLPETIDFELEGLTVAAGPDRVEYDFQDWDVADGPAGVDYAPYFASRDVLAAYASGGVTKAGRVLSGKHLKALQDAHDAMGKVIEAEVARHKIDGEDQPAAKSAVSPEFGADLSYAVSKAVPEQRYTFGPLYAPERKDAHGEYVDADTLQKAVHDYVQQCVDAGNNRLNLQHDDSGDVTIGTWKEICAWPYETTVKMTTPGGDTRDLVFPAGTVYMGVTWDEDAWPAIKSGKLTGLSLGGKAVRVASTDVLEHMGDKIAAAAVDCPTCKGSGKIKSGNLTCPDCGGSGVKKAKDKPNAPAGANMKTHKYVESASDTGVCESCGMSQDEGNHSGTAAKMVDADFVLEFADRLTRKGDTHIHTPDTEVSIGGGEDRTALTG